jgi:hypothetical protein
MVGRREAKRTHKLAALAVQNPGGPLAHLGLAAIPGSRPKPSHHELQHLRAVARAVIGGDDVVADPQLEGERPANLDVPSSRQEAAQSRGHI